MLTTSWAIAALVAVLSIQPILNIFSSHQIMNTSFDPLDLVNTYGAFGSVGKERYNVVFEGTTASNPDDLAAEWKPYPYKGLPVALNERPPQIAPYQLRLDWQMWFAAMGSPNEYPVDLESDLETPSQRSRGGRIVSLQPVPGRTSALHPGRPLSLLVRQAKSAGALVETRATGSLAATFGCE